MTEPEKLTPEEQEDLVAYLDGELGDLDESTVRDMESKLTQNVVVRQEAESLQQTWDLLDYLPRPKAPASFTNKTLERLATIKQTQAASARRWRWIGRISWAAGTLAAGVLSFWLTYHLRYVPEPGPEIQRLLENRHHYDRVNGSIELLEQLDKSGHFAEGS